MTQQTAADAPHRTTSSLGGTAAAYGSVRARTSTHVVVLPTSTTTVRAANTAWRSAIDIEKDPRQRAERAQLPAA